MTWEDCIQGTNTGDKVATLGCIPVLFQNIVNGALLFVGLVTIVLIVFSGYKFITSQGDAKQIEGARNTLTYAIIGLVIILFSFFIINVIGYVTGVTCISDFGFENCK